MPCELEFHEMSTFFRHCSFLWSTSCNLMITWNNYLLVALCPPTILILTSLPFKSWFDTIVSILLLPVSLNQLIFFSLFIHSECVPLLWYFSHFFPYTIGIYLVVGVLREKPIFLFFFFSSKSLAFIRCSVKVG